MEKHHVFWAVIITYLVISFVPSLGAAALYQRARKKS